MVSPPTTSVTLAPFYLRYYAATNSYLGFSSSNRHLYYLSPQGLVDAGTQDTWLVSAGCVALI